MEEQNDLTSEGRDQGKWSFGNYDLIRRIDMGGMGEVYLAHQRTAFQREVAVKIIRDDLSRDPLARARFFREAEVSSHLKHDHILPLQRLHAGALSLGETRQLFSALVQAVAYIHRRGIVHRDLKPSNILLDDEEASGQVYVRLIDFGIAAKQGEMASPPLTPPGQEIGTLAYMAPERLDGIAAPSNDIYSLGVILYQMLTRCLPVEGIIVSGSLPASLEAVVRRCMAAKPEDRYGSAIDILPAFEQSCQALQVSAAPPASQSTLLPFPSVVLSQPIFAENVPGAHTPGETGDLLSLVKRWMQRMW
ncbi:MAG: serine/threonine protein kinase [Chloroflexi bacterium]|nr:MAG: serine/threonine protein kinase [Chloroflexota bacterium]